MCTRACVQCDSGASLAHEFCAWVPLVRALASMAMYQVATCRVTNVRKRWSTSHQEVRGGKRVCWKLVSLGLGLNGGFVDEEWQRVEVDDVPSYYDTPGGGGGGFRGGGGGGGGDGEGSGSRGAPAEGSGARAAGETAEDKGETQVQGDPDVAEEVEELEKMLQSIKQNQE